MQLCLLSMIDVVQGTVYTFAGHVVEDIRAVLSSFTDLVGHPYNPFLILAINVDVLSSGLIMLFGSL
jgi:hypothetical protein